MVLKLSEEKPKISEFLKKNQIAVLGTVDQDNKPHTATVYIYTDENLDIYFMTKEQTAKYRNIKSNPNTSITVYDPVTQGTVQASGAAEEISDHEKANEVFRHILAVTRDTSESAIPPISKIDGGLHVCFRIKPETIRLAEYTNPEHGEFNSLFDTVAVADEEL